VEHMYP